MAQDLKRLRVIRQGLQYIQRLCLDRRPLAAFRGGQAAEGIAAEEVRLSGWLGLTDWLVGILIQKCPNFRMSVLHPCLVQQVVGRRWHARQSAQRGQR